MHISTLKNILDKVDVIDFKYKKVKEQDTFNVFSILRKENDEVNVHSRFITELLCPKGCHGKELIFLKSFLRNVGITDFIFNEILVSREYRDIDILIRNRTQAIIIENKINAGDQDKQLKRYYKLIKQEGISEIKLVYLTLYGEEPSLKSIGEFDSDELNKILTNISYKDNILLWLTDCIKECAINPSIRETIKQYYNLVKKITRQTMVEEESKEMYDLLAQNNSIQSAFKIFENWNFIRQKVELNFWTDLEVALLKEGKEILNHRKYSEYLIWCAINQKSKRNPFFGIMFKIGMCDKDVICLYIERVWESTCPLFFGITALRNGNNREICEESKFDEIVSRIPKIYDQYRNNVWLESTYPKNEINFDVFDEEAGKLINESYRKKYIEDLLYEVNQFIKNCGF